MDFWQSLGKAWAEIVAKTWTDEAFKKKVEADPVAVLKQYGVDCTGKVEIKLLKNTATGMIGLPLPAKPEGLGDQSSRLWAEGGTQFCSTCSTCSS